MRTSGVVVAHHELTFADLTTMEAGTDLDPQLKRLQIGLVNDRFKTEAQGVLIDGCHFANPETDSARVSSRMETHLGLDRFQHRTRDRHFVQYFPNLRVERRASTPAGRARTPVPPLYDSHAVTALADARQLIACEHVHDTGRAKRRSHR
ncbi:MAG: hypothetical protein ABSF85_12565, partial [Terriglobales bacterium]